MARDGMNNQLKKGDKVVVHLTSPNLVGEVLDILDGTLQVGQLAVVTTIPIDPRSGFVPGCFKLHQEGIITQ